MKEKCDGNAQCEKVSSSLCCPARYASTLSLFSSYGNMFIEVLDPLQNCVIIGPIIWRSLNDLGKKEIVFGILKGEVVDVLNDQE